MAKRLQLHKDLEEIRGLAFDQILQAPAVYFQPPSTVQMVYPCIVYHKDNGRTRHADNFPYKTWQGYSIKVIDTNPDSEIPEEVGKMSGISYETSYSVEGLHHTVFHIYR